MEKRTTATIPVPTEAGLRIVATRGDDYLEDLPVAELPKLLADPSAHVWIDCWGSDNPEARGLAEQVFHFHPIAVADCFELREHPKIEGFEGYLFVITHGIALGSTAIAAETIELDVFLAPRYLFTYHERPSRAIAGAVDLVARNHGGALRRCPAALLHTILDFQVDTMEPLLEDLEERVQVLEDGVLVKPTGADLAAPLALKRTSVVLKRWMSKQRDVVLRLARNEFAIVPPNEAILFRDTYDHLHRMTDVLETTREMLTSLHETSLSLSNLRLGEIMKFLTLYTAVLMPLTVIAGIYGMNFEHMPELRQPWGYPATLGLMASVALSVLFYFRRKGWMGKSR